ncbi:hypothetical protein L226DRAFT_538867 [Lentinus tigrinus ALCF2SS1-7]|uniref:uncharacterized protein n=1 Tax=Lentinus tigrinus ALCF2SS1-7 TaxID=1328758 RepID=UPI001165F997|nr:hypothetical protein L226DRAFT_538867 [Lentinus tigrinus ALCF2SS1-7]
METYYPVGASSNDRHHHSPSTYHSRATSGSIPTYPPQVMRRLQQPNPCSIQH